MSHHHTNPFAYTLPPGAYVSPTTGYPPPQVGSVYATAPPNQFMTVLPSANSVPPYNPSPSGVAYYPTGSSGIYATTPSMVPNAGGAPAGFYSTPYNSQNAYTAMSVMPSNPTSTPVGHSSSNPLPFLPVAPSTAPNPSNYYTTAVSHPQLKSMPSLPSFPSAPTSMPQPGAPSATSTQAPAAVTATPLSKPSTVTPASIPLNTKPTYVATPIAAVASTPIPQTQATVTIMPRSTSLDTPSATTTSSSTPPGYSMPALKPPPSSHISRPSNPLSPNRPASKPPAAVAPPGASPYVTPTITPASSSEGSFDGGVSLGPFNAPAQSRPSGKLAIAEVLAAVKNLTAQAEQLRTLLNTRYAKLASGGGHERTEIAEIGSRLDQATRTLTDLQLWFKSDDLQMKFLRSALKGVITAGASLVTAARQSYTDTQESAAKRAVSNVATHQSALALSVKSVVQACDMLTAKAQQVYLPQDWQPPRAEEPPRRHLPVVPASAPATGSRSSFDPKKIDLKKYDVKKVITIQKYFRSYIVRKRFRQLLINMKNDKGYELSTRRQRQKVLKEIEDTERVYVTDLGACVKHFVVPLRTKVAEGKFFDADSWALVNECFRHLETVYSINVELFDQIQKCMKAVPVGRGLGDAFSRLVPQLQPYSDYINSYDLALKALDKARKREPALVSYLQQCRAASGAQLDIESLLIKPVQRLPRYQLLLKELIKFTGADHSDLPGLSEAVLRIAQRVDGMNKSKRQKDNTEKLSLLQNQVAGLPMELADPERYYVKEAPLEVTLPGESHSEPMTVIMLSDALLFTTPRSSKERPYQYVDLCHLRDVQIVDRPGAFAIVHEPSRSEWKCVAKNEADRLGWLNDLKQQLELNILKDMCENHECLHRPVTFRIVHATYGKLNDSVKCRDVTRQLQQICSFQGRKGLELKAEPKSKFLGDPAGSLTSKSLHVMYSSNGQDLSVTFQDSEPVSLPQQRR